MSDFAQHMVTVATELWGDPNKAVSTQRKLAWGSHGSRKVDLEAGTWFDHEAHEGGGVLDLIMRETGCDKAKALQWLTERGLIEDREPRQPKEPVKPKGELVEVKTYRYTNRDGDPLYEVVRYQRRLPDGTWALTKDGTIAKDFRQRRRGPGGEWIWNLDGIGHCLYRHQQLELAIEAGKTIWLPEGEKDVETLVRWGLEATTNSGGAQNWTADLAQHFKGADVVVLVDNDDVGRERGEKVARSLKGIASRIRVLDLSDHVPGLQRKGDVSDWAAMGGLPERLLQIAEQVPDWAPRPPVSKFGARMVDTGGSQVVYDWLVKGMIERGGVFFVVGESQAGKSFFTMDLGMKIARGLDYCGQKVRRGLVIYMACEDAKGVNLRAQGYRIDESVPPGEVIPMVVMEKRLNLMDDESVVQFIAECRAWEEWFGIKLELVIIDTLSVATEGMDEISSVDTSKVLGRLNRIATECQTAVGVVHHFNADGRRARGHSSLTANVSQVIEVRPRLKDPRKGQEPGNYVRDDNKRIVRRAYLQKNKNGPNAYGWEFVLRQVVVGHDEDGKEITTCVLDRPVGQGYAPREGGRLHPDHRMALDALVKVLADMGSDPPASLRLPAGLRVVPYAAWRDEVRRGWTFSTEDEAERDTEMKAIMGRVGRALKNAGYMDRDNTHNVVWATGKHDRPETEVVDAAPAEQKLDPAVFEGAPF